MLTSQQCHILHDAGTERPFSSQLKVLWQLKKIIK
jgi:peptide methionine sulfoxide reductase MsrB